MWIYDNKEYETIHNDNIYGFIYKITFKSGKYYIGKKNFFFYKTLPILKNKRKRENHIQFFYKIVNNKRKYFELVKQESDWKTYTGSIKKDISEPVVRKEILEFAFSKRHLTYLETKYLFLNNVLEDDNAINENILGKFYKGNLI